MSVFKVISGNFVLYVDCFGNWFLTIGNLLNIVQIMFPSWWVRLVQRLAPGLMEEFSAVLLVILGDCPLFHYLVPFKCLSIYFFRNKIAFLKCCIFHNVDKVLLITFFWRTCFLIDFFPLVGQILLYPQGKEAGFLLRG